MGEFNAKKQLPKMPKWENFPNLSKSDLKKVDFEEVNLILRRIAGWKKRVDIYNFFL